MHCRYCKTENFTSIGVCAACGKPLAESAQQIAFGQKIPVPHRLRGASHAGVQARYAFHIPAAMSIQDTDPVASAAPAANDGGNRTPPQPDAAAEESSRPFFREPVMDPDELEKRFPSSRKKRSGFGRVLLGIAAAAVFLVVAVAAGILGALWIGNHGNLQAMLAMVAPDRVLTLAPPGRPEMPVSTVTSPGELPYDGLTPEPADSSDTAVIAPAAPEESPGAIVPPVDNADMPETPETPADVSAIAPLAAPANPSEEEPPAPARTTSTVSAKQAVAISDKASGPASQKVKKAHPPRQKIARGKEISQIQQQAAEELKKKTEKRRLARMKQQKAARAVRTEVAFDSRAAAQSRRNRTYALLQRCNRIGNVIGREQCKWKTCNGKWGRDGCP